MGKTSYTKESKNSGSGDLILLLAVFIVMAIFGR